MQMLLDLVSVHSEITLYMFDSSHFGGSYLYISMAGNIESLSSNEMTGFF